MNGVVESWEVMVSVALVSISTALIIGFGMRFYWRRQK